MKLLMIAPYPLFPVSSGGKVRVVELARNLSELGLEVSVLAPYHFTQRRDLHEGEPFRLHQIKYPFVLPYALTDRPFPYEWLTSFHPGLHLFTRRFLTGHDIYQFEHAQFARLVDYLPPGSVVTYDAHNVEYDYIRSQCRGTSIEGLVTNRMHRLERHLVERSAHVFTCSERDQGRLHLLYGVPKDRMSLAPNGIKAARDRAPGPVRSVMQRWPQLRRFPRLALFSGSNVAHNRAAVHFILERLAPALRDECAFVVQGGCGVSFGRETAANVCFDVSADGFALYADGSTVGLNPIEQGSGSNLKLLQYLYHGMPVISTPFGMRGYETLRRFVTVAPLEGFADALRTAAHAPRPEPEALVREFGWRTIGQSIVNVYATLRAEKRISGDSHGDGQASAARR